MFSELAMTREALDMMTAKPWSRVEVGSREGAPVRKNTQQLENFSRRRGGLQEVGSTRFEAGEGEGLQGRHMFEVLEDQVDHGSNWWGWIECG